jgi:hypothetical protein
MICHATLAGATGMISAVLLFGIDRTNRKSISLQQAKRVAAFDNVEPNGSLYIAVDFGRTRLLRFRYSADKKCWVQFFSQKFRRSVSSCRCSRRTDEQPERSHTRADGARGKIIHVPRTTHRSKPESIDSRLRYSPVLPHRQPLAMSRG